MPASASPNAAPGTQSTPTLDVAAIRDEFPILAQEVHGKPLAYLDNAATSQKPRAVLDAIQRYYTHDNANVHRGLHTLAERATRDYEDARLKLARFVNAADAAGVVFTRGATEAINLVAHSYARHHPTCALKPGDQVMVTEMEHHSNIVPWQIACEMTGAELVVCPVDDHGSLDLHRFRELLDPGSVKIAAFSAVSNVLGTVNPVAELVTRAKRAGAVTIVDACQAPAHQRIDVQRWGCDFLAISGHKMFGPTGIGALIAKPDKLAKMPPYQGGGEMISRVTFEKTTYNDPPHRFEAGTPNIAGAIALGAAVDWLSQHDYKAIKAHEQTLIAAATEKLEEIDGLRLIGTAPGKAAVASFVIDGIHAYDLGPVLDRQGVAVRTGHHCCEPLMDRFGVPATVRASFALYNTLDEVDRLIDGLNKAITFFR
ncbi:MAG: SufS family cysteine desulfurase [Planctomycetota bacterium]